ncbi:MAG TPA: CNNM domain-containing protein, partial [Chryseolinea sp.]|nr:CNNM domain-containing protein [Chryseolinea sp.]
MDSHFLFGVGITLFFSFFFTSFEIAYLIADKTNIEKEASAGSLNSRILVFFFNRPSWLVGTTRVGYCTSLVFFSYFMARVLLPIVAEMLPVVLDHMMVTIFVQIIFSTLLILLTAQFLPKVLGNIYPNRVLQSSAILFGISFLILFPLTRLILAMS